MSLTRNVSLKSVDIMARGFDQANKEQTEKKYKRIIATLVVSSKQNIGGNP